MTAFASLTDTQVARLCAAHQVAPEVLEAFFGDQLDQMLERLDDTPPREHGSHVFATLVGEASEQRRFHLEEQQRLALEALNAFAEQEAESEPAGLARMVPFPRLDGLEVVYLGRDGTRVVVQSREEPSPRSGEGAPYRPPSS